MSTVAVSPTRRRGGQSRTSWLVQTLERVDRELQYDQALDETPYVVPELIEFRDYLQAQLYQPARSNAF